MSGNACPNKQGHLEGVVFENERYNPAIIEGRGSQKLQYSEYGEHLYTPCDVNVYLKLIDFVHNIVIICGFLESPFITNS